MDYLYMTPDEVLDDLGMRYEEYKKCENKFAAKAMAHGMVEDINFYILKLKDTIARLDKQAHKLEQDLNVI